MTDLKTLKTWKGILLDNNPWLAKNGIVLSVNVTKQGAIMIKVGESSILLSVKEAERFLVKALSFIQLVKVAEELGVDFEELWKLKNGKKRKKSEEEEEEEEKQEGVKKRRSVKKKRREQESEEEEEDASKEEKEDEEKEELRTE